MLRKVWGEKSERRLLRKRRNKLPQFFKIIYNGLKNIFLLLLNKHFHWLLFFYFFNGKREFVVSHFQSLLPLFFLKCFKELIDCYYLFSCWNSNIKELIHIFNFCICMRNNCIFPDSLHQRWRNIFLIKNVTNNLFYYIFHR